MGPSYYDLSPGSSKKKKKENMFMTDWFLIEIAIIYRIYQASEEQIII